MEEETKNNPDEGLRSLLDKYKNDALGLATSLYDQTYQLREKNREVRIEIEELKKKLPGDDAVLLTKADVERWEAYKKLGKVEDLKSIITDRDTLKAENAKAQRKELLRKVAEAEGFDPDVLAELATDSLNFEIKEIKDKEGKDIKQAMVIVKDGDKQETKPLADYASEKWAKFMLALKQEQNTKKQEGTRYLLQKKGEPPTPPDRVAEERKALVAKGDYQL